MTEKCKGCGANILWAVTDNGRNIPLDEKYEMRLTLDDQNVARVQRTYISHFATCPKADTFRMRRQA